MPNYNEVRAWQRHSYIIRLDDFKKEVVTVQVDGIAMGGVPLGLHFRDLYGIDVAHIPSGLRIANLPTLGAAMEFVHQIAHLCDWTAETPDVDAAVVTGILNHITAGSYPPRIVP